jgi:class 3 adenylate cyclase
MPTTTESADESNAVQAKTRRRRRGPSAMSIQSKLLVMLLVTSILSAAVVGAIGFNSGRTSLRASVFERLTEIRGAQTRQLEAKFNDLESSLIVYTRGETTTDAIAAFTTAFDQLGSATISPQQWQSVVDYYTNRFGAAKKAQTGTDFDIDALLPTSNATKYLQANYTAPFVDPNNGIDMDDARDGSPWSAANARFNDFFREIVQQFQFEDALLLDTRGNIVYSAYKGVDLGTNILDGPFSEDGFQDAYQKVLASNAVDFVAVTDFGDYQPADEPTAWMLAPAGPRGRVQGVLALQFPISKINNLMTANRQWESAGMGQTGETILVGPDNLMRSDSRLFLTDPELFRRDVVEAGTSPDIADESIRQGGTTLVQPIDSEAIRLAQRGQAGTIIEDDYLGRRTLQAYGPVDLHGLHWSIVAKVDTDEAFAPVFKFTRTLVLSTVVIIFVVSLAAMLLARLFVRPIRRLEAGAQQIGAGDYHVTLPVQSKDEFGDLTVAFNEMSRNLTIKEELLKEQRNENDRLMLSLMPEPVVQRYRDGEQTIAQDHQNVTVIFADIVGMDALSARMNSEEELAIVNELTRQFDAAAESFGVEPVRILHNGYLASCGLSTPRLDNVRRTIDFAAEMERIVERFNSEHGDEFALRAGIDTGTVTSGLVGRSTLAYDMWGTAVNLAYRVQSGSPQPGVFVTGQVYDVMRDSREFTAAGTIGVDGEEQPIWRLTEGES